MEEGNNPDATPGKRPIFRQMNREFIEFISTYKHKREIYATENDIKAIAQFDARLAYLLERHREFEVEIYQYLDEAYMKPHKERIG